jgi:hypothetical protein
MPSEVILSQEDIDVVRTKFDSEMQLALEDALLKNKNIQL